MVYGTLRPPIDNASARYLRQHSHAVGEATFPGLLFDLGGYPGAIYQLDGATTVYGTVYDIGQHKSSILACLDQYEGTGEAFDQPNEYVRTVIPVRQRNDVIACWVYLYNLLICEKPVIESGDYVQHVSQQK